MAQKWSSLFVGGMSWKERKCSLSISSLERLKSCIEKKKKIYLSSQDSWFVLEEKWLFIVKEIKYNITNWLKILMSSDIFLVIRVFVI